MTHVRLEYSTYTRPNDVPHPISTLFLLWAACGRSLKMQYRRSWFSNFRQNHIFKWCYIQAQPTFDTKRACNRVFSRKLSQTHWLSSTVLPWQTGARPGPWKTSSHVRKPYCNPSNFIRFPAHYNIAKYSCSPARMIRSSERCVVMLALV